eukprot:TRINITY_DN23171_c0_g1_i1.p1 TRINITY_DN23171_c0_g1~~TRINITY_DN23171_c0_g1_i1.p1  ORF type:complete len:125 (-),score=10.60 TRINITY_DN23171_c0_g1_i1:45-419(-)
MSPTVMRATAASLVVLCSGVGAGIANARLVTTDELAIFSLGAAASISVIACVFCFVFVPEDMQWKLSHKMPFRRQAGAGFAPLPMSDEAADEVEQDQFECSVDGSERSENELENPMEDVEIYQL